MHKYADTLPNDTDSPTVTIVGHVCIDENTIEGIRHRSWGSSALYIASYYAKGLELSSTIISSKRRPKITRS